MAILREMIDKLISYSKDAGVLTTPLLIVGIVLGVLLGMNSSLLNGILVQIGLPPYEQIKAIVTPQETEVILYQRVFP